MIISFTLIFIFACIWGIFKLINLEDARIAQRKEMKLIEMMRHFESCNLTTCSDVDKIYQGQTEFGKIILHTDPTRWIVEIWYKGKYTQYRNKDATRFITLFM